MKRIFMLLVLFLYLLSVNVSATVSSTDNKIIYTGDAIVTVFPYNFKVFEDTDLAVEIQDIATGVETIQVLNVDYTVSGVGDAVGGNVTMIVSPIVGEKLIVKRILPLTQETDLVDNTVFSLELLEEGYDRLVMIAQELDERVSRALLADITSTADYTLPSPDAGKVLKWNATEDGLINSTYDPDEQVANAEASATSAAASAVTASSSASAASTSADEAAASAASINLPTIQAGDAGKQLQVNPGETGYLFISPVETDESVKVSADDTTPGYLKDKLVAGEGLYSTENNPGANETLTIDCELATDTNLGVATFDSGDFTVTAGDVVLNAGIKVEDTVVIGEYEGTGSNVVITGIGFRPKIVEIFLVDGGGVSCWVHDDFDGGGIYTAWHGSSGSAGVSYEVGIDADGFTAKGAQVVANAETFTYKCWNY